MNPFISHLNSLVNLPEEAQVAVNNLTVNKKLPAGSTLLRNGDVCKEFHFLASGLARVFYHKDGKEVTAWFAAEQGRVNLKHIASYLGISQEHLSRIRGIYRKN